MNDETETDILLALKLELGDLVRIVRGPA